MNRPDIEAALGSIVLVLKLNERDVRPGSTIQREAEAAGVALAVDFLDNLGRIAVAAEKTALALQSLAAQHGAS
jgi:hypothetical protein